MAVYRVVLVFHILAIISWMCGVLYLFRLFINHAEKGRTNRDIHDLLSGMESRLYRIITRPAMIIATFAGGAMLYLQPGLLTERWMWVKLLGVLALIGVTAYGSSLITLFANIENAVPSSKRLRLLNEVPTALMILIICMVILRPHLNV